MKIALFASFVLQAVLIPQGIAQSDRAHGQEPRAPIALSASRMTPLRALMRVASENRIPLGVILGAQPTLCAYEKPVQIQAMYPQDAIEQILAGTGYTYTLEDGVYIVAAPDLTDHERSLLGFKYDRFSATHSNINDAGALLGGYIISVAEGAGGIATSTFFAESEKTFDIKLSSVTARQIANRIVSMNGKGVWVFYPTLGSGTAGKIIVPIRVLAYTGRTEDFDQLSCKISGDAMK